MVRAIVLYIADNIFKPVWTCLAMRSANVMQPTWKTKLDMGPIAEFKL